MLSAVEPYLETRRSRRAEHDRPVELGVFVGERLELLDGPLTARGAIVPAAELLR